MRRLKDFLRIDQKLFLTYLFSRKTGHFQDYAKKKKCYVFLGADYGNLGDVAITQAQIAFLKEILPDYVIIEIPISKTFAWMKDVKAVTSADDIITLIGGGNMSVKYADIEYCRQFVISQFPNNPIIGFPQSLDLVDAKPSQLKHVRKVYCNHKKLLLFFRDHFSYDKAQKLFP